MKQQQISPTVVSDINPVSVEYEVAWSSSLPESHNLQ